MSEGAFRAAWADMVAQEQRAQARDELRLLTPTQETPTVPEDRNPKAARAIADGKPRLDLLDTAMTHGCAEVLATGAARYGQRNWRISPINASTYVGALRRHTDEWADGADADKDSGKHPLHHVAATCNVILDAIKHGTLVDDRDFAESRVAPEPGEPVGAGVSKPHPICGIDGKPCPMLRGCTTPCTPGSGH